MSSLLSSKPELLASRPVRVMLEALRENRLSHSLILSGENQETLEAVAHRLAAELFAVEDTPAALARHPDFFTLRATGKMRQISAGNTRELIRKLNHSSREGGAKVAILYDADRMHDSAANIFLKTLEEPPVDTTILLLTSRPHFLLPTIRSRCLHFRLPNEAADEDFSEPLSAWLSDYSAWLEGMDGGLGSKDEICRQVMRLYGLVSRFSPLLKATVADAWKEEKARLPEGLTDEEELAVAEGMRIAMRDRLFTAMEQRLRRFAASRLDRKGTLTAFAGTIADLERAVGLLRVNLQEGAALEGFLLAAMRHWGRR